MKNIYVCGPTVYSEPHIGNMRPILVFDLYIRALNALGTKTNFIHNITDIDDKIIKRALEEKVTEQEISSRYEAQYKELLNSLNVKSINEMPTVLENMDLIINFIKRLVEANKAYVVDGNVYFDVNSVSTYGSLSNRKLDEMQYEEGNFKKHPADFALWKKTDLGITFDSPWGKGRPGWHTECVVFIEKYLKGESLDIHGGGIDLLFPHHENENAQYEALFNKELAKEWRHVGHLNYEGEKMSKSLGNLISTSEFISRFGVDTLRYIFMTTSYSSPIDLTNELITSAKEQVEKLSRAFNKAQLVTSSFTADVKQIAQFISEWNFAMANKEISEVLKDFNKQQSETNASRVLATLKLLGFAFTKNIISEEDKNTYQKWEKARKDADFASADILRNILKERNLI